MLNGSVTSERSSVSMSSTRPPVPAGTDGAGHRDLVIIGCCRCWCLIILYPIYPAFFEHVPFLLCGGDGGGSYGQDVTHRDRETAVSFDYTA